MEARSAASLSQLEAVSIKSEVPTEPSRSHRHLFDVSIPAAEPVRGDEEATKRRRRGDEEASCFLTAIVTAVQDTQLKTTSMKLGSDFAGLMACYCKWKSLDLQWKTEPIFNA